MAPSYPLWGLGLALDMSSLQGPLSLLLIFYYYWGPSMDLGPVLKYHTTSAPSNLPTTFFF